MNIILCFKKLTEPRENDEGILDACNDPLQLPSIKMLSCIRRKRGNKVSIKLVLRSHASE
jgi:hypothetical protein